MDATSKSKFKVGDRVRLTEDNGGYGKQGDTGTVVEVCNRDRDCDIKFDREVNGGRYWYAEWDKLEPAPLRIEAGKYYRTRDGRGVGPMVETDDAWTDCDGLTAAFSVTLDGERMDWTVEGLWLSRFGEDRPEDLISEWTADDEPKRYSSCAAAEVDMQREEYGGGTTSIGDIVRKHDTAIVARLENGQPRPSPRPFVHHSTDAAKTEAARLAKMNPGTEFAVYERVGSAREEKRYDYEWQRLAAGGERLKAVRELRRIAGVSLKSAVDAVDYVKEYA